MLLGSAVEFYMWQVKDILVGGKPVMLDTETNRPLGATQIRLRNVNDCLKFCRTVIEARSSRSTSWNPSTSSTSGGSDTAGKSGVGSGDRSGSKSTVAEAATGGGDTKSSIKSEVDGSEGAGSASGVDENPSTTSSITRGTQSSHAGSSRSHAAIMLRLLRVHHGRLIEKRVAFVDLAGAEERSENRTPPMEVVVGIMRGGTVSQDWEAFAINFELSSILDTVVA